MTVFNVILFDDFETLDAFGPIEIVGKMPKSYELGCYSLRGGVVASSQGVRVETLPFSAIDPAGCLLIPGGMGTRRLAGDVDFIGRIKDLAQEAPYVLAVCTGAALLARTGLLDRRRATSNKMAFEWVCGQGAQVSWVRQARWVKDGKFYTSSGVSAGMDMTVGFVRDIHGNEAARDLCRHIEYIWHDDADDDPFAAG